MSKIVHVAVGVIYDGEQILLSKRHASAHQGGKWEFPGGKVEDEETVETALARELKEELSITPIDTEALMIVTHKYEEYSVLLDVWRVLSFSGAPVGVEGQEVKWFSLNELIGLEFPEANYTIVQALMNSTNS